MDVTDLIHVDVEQDMESVSDVLMEDELKEWNGMDCKGPRHSRRWKRGGLKEDGHIRGTVDIQFRSLGYWVVHQLSASTEDSSCHGRPPTSGVGNVRRRRHEFLGERESFGFQVVATKNHAKSTSRVDVKSFDPTSTRTGAKYLYARLRGPSMVEPSSTTDQ